MTTMTDETRLATATMMMMLTDGDDDDAETTSTRTTAMTTMIIGARAALEAAAACWAASPSPRKKAPQKSNQRCATARGRSAVSRPLCATPLVPRRPDPVVDEDLQQVDVRTVHVEGSAQVDAIIMHLRKRHNCSSPGPKARGARGSRALADQQRFVAAPAQNPIDLFHAEQRVCLPLGGQRVCLPLGKPPRRLIDWSSRRTGATTRVQGHGRRRPPASCAPSRPPP